MKYKPTIILLLVVAVLGAIAYSLSKQPTSEELRKKRARLLPELAEGPVDRIVLADGRQRIVCLRAADDSWRIDSPIKTRADNWEVQEIVRQFETVQSSFSVFPRKGLKLDLARYGLDDPARRITFHAQDTDKQWTVLLGGPSGAGDSVYVALEGQEGVFAIPKGVVSRAEVTVPELRSKRIAPRISGDQLRRLSVEAAEFEGDAAFQVEAQEVGAAWEITRPFRDLADRDQIENLAAELYNHRLSEDDFVSDDPAQAPDYGLESPALTLSIQGDGESQTILCGVKGAGESAAFFAMEKGEGAIVRISRSLFESLRKGPGDLRMRSLVAAPATDVKQLQLKRPEGDVVVSEEGGAWHIQGAPRADADPSLMDQILSDLASAEIKSFVDDRPADLAPYGLDDKTRILLSLEGKDGKTLAAIAFGRAAGEGAVYAQRVGYPPVLRVPQKRYYEPFNRGRIAFLDRQALDERPEAAVRLRLRRGGEEIACARKEKGPGWRLTEPAGGPADEEAANRIVDAFSLLRVAAYAALKADSPARYGLAHPYASLEVAYRTGGEDAPERVRTLSIGRATSEPAEGRYATLDGDNRVFVLSDAKVETLLRNPADKTVCKAEDVTALAFRRRGEETARFHLNADNGTWLSGDGAPAPEATGKALDGIRSLLENFQAAGVAAYDAKRPDRYGFDDPFLVVEIETRTVLGKKIVVGGKCEGGRFVDGPATDYILIITPEQAQDLAAPLPPAQKGEKLRKRPGARPKRAAR